MSVYSHVYDCWFSTGGYQRCQSYYQSIQRCRSTVPMRQAGQASFTCGLPTFYFIICGRIHSMKGVSQLLTGHPTTHTAESFLVAFICLSSNLYIQSFILSPSAHHVSTPLAPIFQYCRTHPIHTETIQNTAASLAC